jgi:hypothetical protein
VVIPVLHVTSVQVFTPEFLSPLPGITVTVTYEDLVDWVSREALAGDRDAAELTLLCSVARV